ncbi:ABC transporter substrate-binding protein [Clostridium sp. DJ247]|uniref:ABC transporter substrate-binding protein n=1 Tax=Clostridium sp. DJ247 TaxID=2726188 RepID=UPI0016243691|nr:ABC transporter substrate-binding protein [Clostridium sp. DJ247]MBC2582344.1 ABC transporter substrate-binding protein [Clostridium sp. DJ247]
MKNKKISLIAMFIVGIMLLVTGCGNSNTKAISSNDTKNQSLIPVRFGVESAVFSTQFKIANAKGFFTKNGIQPQLVTFSFGIDTINAALADQIDVGLAADFATLSRFSSGDLRLLSFISTGKAENTKYVARDGITSPQQLKGKAIGVSKGTVGEYVLARYLEKNNIKLNEVKIQGFTSNAEQIAGFERGDIKGGFFAGVSLDKVLKTSGAKVIGTQADIPFQSRAFLIVKDKLLKEKPEAAKRIILALDEATRFINENPEAAAEIEAKIIKAPKDSVLREIKDYTFDIRLADDDVKQLNDVYDYAVKNNLIKGGFNLKDKIITDPLKQAIPAKLTYNPDNSK